MVFFKKSGKQMLFVFVIILSVEVFGIAGFQGRIS